MVFIAQIHNYIKDNQNIILVDGLTNRNWKKKKKILDLKFKRGRVENLALAVTWSMVVACGMVTQSLLSRPWSFWTPQAFHRLSLNLLWFCFISGYPWYQNVCAEPIAYDRQVILIVCVYISKNVCTGTLEEMGPPPVPPTSVICNFPSCGLRK